MSVEQVDYERVFDGHDSYVPKAIVNVALQDVARAFHFHAQERSDGLDDFLAIPLHMTDRDFSVVKFALWRHAGNPVDTFAIHLPLHQRGADRVVDDILAALRIPDRVVLWRDSDAAAGGTP